MIKRLNRAVVPTTIYSNLLSEVLSIAKKLGHTIVIPANEKRNPLQENRQSD